MGKNDLTTEVWEAEYDDETIGTIEPRGSTISDNTHAKRHLRRIKA